MINIQKQRNQRANIPPAQPLAQAEGPRSDESFPSLRQAPFA